MLNANPTDRANAATAPLAAGRTTIEASAGSGKTRAITTLVARFVVEKGCGLERILVVTFTKAAAAELRQRIRKTLREIQQSLTAGSADSAAGDDVGPARELLAHWQAIVELDPGEIRRRIDQALFDIDRANIFTIHGFCQRALTEFAFETGFSFDFKVRDDGGGLVDNVAQDYYLRRFHGAPERLASHALKQKFLPGELAAWFDKLRGRPGLEIRGVPEGAFNLGAAEENYRWAFENARALWDTTGGFGNLLRENPALNRNKYRRPKVKERLADMRCRLFTGGLPNDLKVFGEQARWLGGKQAAASCKKGYPPPEHPLFGAFDALADACEQLAAALDGWLLQTRKEFFEQAPEEIRQAIRAERRLSYDDLLLETQHALEAETGAQMARQIRERYPVALIDEFQDTDPVQARIFQRIYDCGEPSPGGFSSLFMVGDPKQCVYEFRGADIFAHLAARHSASDSLRLRRNWRSAPGLVQAVNALFAATEAFTIPELELTPALPGRAEGNPLMVDGEPWRPFCLRLFADTKTVDAANAAAAAATAAEITQLLALARAGRAKLGGAALRAGDIAVLARTRYQGRLVGGELRKRGGKYVEIDNSSVFATREAKDLHRLLLALANPSRLDLRRAALTSDLFGMSAADLLALHESDEVWDEWAGRFGAWREIWFTTGVGAVLRRIIDAGDGAVNLLRHDDGPRRLTNVYHLTELLQQVETEDRLPPAGVAAWFGRRVVEPDKSDHRSDEAKLRIDSDEDLVKITTIHGSKGLEFPVVYLPFLWHSQMSDETATVSFHQRRPGATGECEFPAVLHLQPDDAAYAAREMENFGESLRLLYVALTRAKERCVVYWKRVTSQGRKKELPPLAWVLYSADRREALTAAEKIAAARLAKARESSTDSADEMSKNPPTVPDPVRLAYNELREKLKEKTADEFLGEAIAFADQCPDAVEIRQPDSVDELAQPLGVESRAPALACREFTRATRRIRQQTSFSALASESAAPASQAHIEAEAPDYDERGGGAVSSSAVAAAIGEGEVEARSAERNAFNFPRGMVVGSCLHAIFEALDRWPERELSEICRWQLEHAGIDSKWVPTAQAMVENTRAARLRGVDGDSFSLAEIEHRLVEMEFTFPVEGLECGELGELLAGHGYPGLLGGAADEQAIHGYLRGFIDLVFESKGRWYILDYKSNWLGDRLRDYERERLGAAMAEHRYPLQYLLYLLALHRYLRSRLTDYAYERHIGGAYYLFLRGIGAADDSGRGVWFDRPARPCIEALDNYFAGLSHE